MEKIKFIILGVLFMGTLSSCSSVNEYSDTAGVILPHHLLVEKYIDEVYSNIAKHNEIKRIILLSPNHFNYGFNFIQTTDELENAKLDNEYIKALSGKNAVFVEPVDFEKEHGITAHIKFINKYFPEADVIPITFKNLTPKNKLDKLINQISETDFKNTLIIASIDFTHYAREDYAYKDDMKLVEWLEAGSEENSSQQDYDEIIEMSKSSDLESDDAIAIDSPESLYVLFGLMKKQNSEFHFVKRTSSNSLMKSDAPEDNTSHIFGIFKNS